MENSPQINDLVHFQEPDERAEATNGHLWKVNIVQGSPKTDKDHPANTYCYLTSVKTGNIVWAELRKLSYSPIGPLVRLAEEAEFVQNKLTSGHYGTAAALGTLAGVLAWVLWHYLGWLING